MRIRSEEPEDVEGIVDVNLAAFPTAAEAHLINALRHEATPFVSIVAEEDGVVLGHISFSPTTLECSDTLRIMGLGPLAVMPARQRQGIGSALVRAGLDACRQLGAGAVVVVGHPGYYPRFGFLPASRFGLKCLYDVPDEVFMAVELEPGALQHKTGTVAYHAAFDAV